MLFFYGRNSNSEITAQINNMAFFSTITREVFRISDDKNHIQTLLKSQYLDRMDSRYSDSNRRIFPTSKKPIKYISLHLNVT